jgi:hypothetical protein
MLTTNGLAGTVSIVCGTRFLRPAPRPAFYRVILSPDHSR